MTWSMMLLKLHKTGPDGRKEDGNQNDGHRGIPET